MTASEDPPEVSPPQRTDDEKADTNADDEFERILREVARTPVTSSPLLRGTLFAERYRIGEELGRGGMGCVVSAFDESLGREVALKLLSNSASVDDNELMKEARAAAKINHARVVSVYDVGEDASGRAYLAMERVDGETLRAHLVRSGILAPQLVQGTALDVAEALRELHKRGLIHGDLKPSNIILGEDMRAKVLDFGLARAIDDDDDVDAGTLAYLAPDVFAGASRNPRSDVFAFGALLYEVITGERAVTGVTPAQVRASLENYCPPESSTATSRAISGRLLAIALRSLAVDPAERYADGAQLYDAIEQVLSKGGARRARGWSTLALALAGAVLGAVALVAIPPLLNRVTSNDERSFALASIPRVSRRQEVQARFRVATERWYAGDDSGAARALGDLDDDDNSVATLLLRSFVGHFELSGSSREEVHQRLRTATLGKGTRLAQSARLVLELRAPLRVPHRANDKDHEDDDTNEIVAHASAFIHKEPEAYFENLVVALALGRRSPAESRARLQEIIAVDPGPARPYLHLAWGEMRGGASSNNLARAFVEKGLTHDVKNIALLSVKGQIELGDGNLEAARAIFSEVLTRAPAALEVRFDRAEVAFLLGDDGFWRSELDAIASGPYAPSHRGRGIALHARLPWSRADFVVANARFSQAMRILAEAHLWREIVSLHVERTVWAILSEDKAEQSLALVSLDEQVRRPALPEVSRAHLRALRHWLSMFQSSAHAATAVDVVELEELVQLESELSQHSFPHGATPRQALALTRVMRAAVSSANTSRPNSERAIDVEEELKLAFLATSSPSSPLAAGSLWDQIVRERLATKEKKEKIAAGEDAVVEVKPKFDLEASAATCLKVTLFEKLWCRPLLAAHALRRARDTQGKERFALLSLVATLTPSRVVD